MSQNISLEEIKKFWPKDAPEIINVQKYVSKYKNEKIVIKYDHHSSLKSNIYCVAQGTYNQIDRDLNEQAVTFACTLTCSCISVC